jgi:hypothetical protein
MGDAANGPVDLGRIGGLGSLAQAEELAAAHDKVGRFHQQHMNGAHLAAGR